MDPSENEQTLKQKSGGVGGGRVLRPKMKRQGDEGGVGG